MNFDPTTDVDKFQITLFLTPPHSCGYLPDQSASTLFVDPMYKMNAASFQFLLGRGFRRSGSQVYRPYCGACQACVPVRIPVSSWDMKRSFRRIIKRNRVLNVKICSPEFSEERFLLYKKYVASRHADGPMANPSESDFLSFLGCTWGKTLFVEFRLNDQLLMVAVLDHQAGTLSAVYTFFDPEEKKRSLGTYGILWAIEEARRLGKQWLYLGYWIDSCQKMAYKSRFFPLEAYVGQEWVVLSDDCS
ncbi:MAG: arginyltransferase [Magnetococcales bacterium]|nr:arginyltransferase [Magnetococcales bacterium]